MKIKFLFTLLLIRFYQVQNIKSITYLTVSHKPTVEWTYHYQIENLGSFQYWPKWASFFWKKGSKNLTTLYSIPFLVVLHQNKALHNFHKRRQRPRVDSRARSQVIDVQTQMQSFDFFSEIQLGVLVLRHNNNRQFILYFMIHTYVYVIL